MFLLLKLPPHPKGHHCLRRHYLQYRHLNIHGKKLEHKHGNSLIIKMIKVYLAQHLAVFPSIHF